MLGTGMTRDARYMAVYLPRFACDWLVRHHPALRGTALVTIAKDRGGLTVISASRRAVQVGVTEGMRLADARAVEPGLEAWDADPARDAKALDAMADWCERWSPLVSLDPPHGLFLDITGGAHLFGGEAALGGELISSLRCTGYEAYAGNAATPGAAWAAVRYRADARSPVAIIREDVREALASLPVAALRLTQEHVTTLQRLGLRCISDLRAAAIGIGQTLRLRRAAAAGPSAMCGGRAVEPTPSGPVLWRAAGLRRGDLRS